MKRLIIALVSLALFACVKWPGDPRGWHRPSMGMEVWFARDYSSGKGYGSCKNVQYPGVKVYSARWDESPINRFAGPNCLGDFWGAIDEGRQAAGFTSFVGDESDGRPLRIIFTDDQFTCGQTRKFTDACVHVGPGLEGFDGITILANWWTPHTSLKRAMLALRQGPTTPNPWLDGAEWN